MLLGVFVVVIEAQKLEMHSKTELHGWKTNIPTLNLKLNYVKKMLVSLNILYAISEKPLNLGNKIILEQKQDISAGLSLTKSDDIKICGCNEG